MGLMWKNFMKLTTESSGKSPMRKEPYDGGFDICNYVKTCITFYVFCLLIYLFVSLMIFLRFYICNVWFVLANSRIYNVFTCTVCNFQTMKSSVELNSLLSKSPGLLYHLIRRGSGRLENEAFMLNLIVSSKQ